MPQPQPENALENAPIMNAAHRERSLNPEHQLCWISPRLPVTKL
jgi:hypothetical protein